MVYALAAYSITIGVLALYGVAIRHRERVAGAERQRAALQAPAAASAGGGFNIGASLLAPLWLWAHGMKGPGVAIGLACLALWPLASRALWVPFLFVAVVPVAAGAALGFVGNRIAAEARGVDTAAALSETQLPWALAGIGLHAFVLPWLVYFFFLR